MGREGPRRGAVVVAVCAALAAASEAGAQPSSVDVVMARVAASVQGFVDDFSNVVAEEEYLQQFRLRAGRRRLTSDFLLVKYPGEEKLLLTFRDVLAVDGRPVRDQQERVTRLFLEPFADAVRRASEIQREGARHTLARGRLMDPLGVIALCGSRITRTSGSAWAGGRLSSVRTSS